MLRNNQQLLQIVDFSDLPRQHRPSPPFAIVPPDAIPVVHETATPGSIWRDFEDRQDLSN
jgi:hypothetical protein